jgi:predicted hotdog family 3-hydroxylacyl-ACP dehydratase
MLLTKENITKIIPQQVPFVMVDNLLVADEKGFKSTFKVEDTNIFFKADKLQEPALIENIAQTVAAGFGYVNQQAGGEPKIGFIGGISKLKIHALPSLNTKIETTVTHLHRFENIYLVKGENFCNGELLVECEMKIVVQE